jgi:Uma2 family endonuclease
MPNQHILRDGAQFNLRNDFIPNMHLRCEMLDGDIIPVPIPAIRNQAISLRFASALLQYVDSRGLGRVLPAPCSVVLSNKIVMQPDIVFIKNERRGLIGKRSLQGAPDLVVEVLSPDVRKKDFRLKKRIYERFGVQEYWLVDPDAAAVETMIWSELGYISISGFDKSDKLSSPLLPNLNLDLSGAFETDDT